MKTEKHFRDSIHGYINVPICIVSKIIDTPLFQRLQDIEQTGMRPLFPAAKHNRFSHSLGVYQLGKEAAKRFRGNAEGSLGKDGQHLGSHEYRLLQDKDPDLPALEPRDAANLDAYWWDKYELLFSLACLLHDCAHAPYSHTYEFFYEIPNVEIDNDFLERLEIGEGDRDSLLAGRIQLLNKALLEECPSKSFVKDFSIFRKANDDKRLSVNANFHKAKPHERLSAVMIGREYRDAIMSICEELLSGNPLINRLSIDDDIEFMVRCVIGMHYQAVDADSGLESSIKNCLISLLNSNMLDVDGLDYMVRDAYNSGVDNGRIDYQRFFGSLTVAPVERYSGSEVNERDITGLWTADTVFESSAPISSQDFDLNGKFQMSFNRNKPASENSSLDWLDIKGKDIKEFTNNCALKFMDTPVKIKVGKRRCPDFKIECKSAVIANGRFSGTISGRRIIERKAETLRGSEKDKNEKAIPIEYVLVYDRACISTIEHAISSRNFEYKWIYSHPKVVYYSSFLLCYLMRMSARYLCCKQNPDNKGFYEDGFMLESCDGCTLANSNEPDFMISKILGFDTYISKAPREDIEQNLGYLFYRSSDSDMRALFKSIMIDNDLRDCPIPSISKYFDAFFARKHQKTLWKSYNEFRGIFDEDFGSVEMDALSIQLLDPGKTSQKDYKILEGKVKEKFESRGIKNPICVRAYLNLKEIDRYNTLIKTADGEISRYADVVSDETSYPKSEFFYLYYDSDGSDRPTNDELKRLFKEVAEL